MKNKLILALTADPGFNKSLEAAARTLGRGWRVAENGREGLRMASTGDYPIAFIDYDMGAIDGVTYLSALKGAESTRNIRAVLVLESDDERLRQKGVEAGMATCIEKSASPEEIASIIETVLEQMREEMEHRAKVVAIDDSNIVAKLYSQILSKHNFDFRVITDPARTIAQVEEFMPDLILMDQNMPGVSGVELVREIRRRPEFAHIRIVMVTSEKKSSSVVEALESGAADFLTKPFVEEELLARMRVHLNFKKLYDDLALAYTQLELLKDKLETLSITDGLTGLYNHRHFYDTLSGEMEGARRNGEKLSLLLLDIDYFKKFNDSHGHKAGDTALKKVAEALLKSIREGDTAARYGGEEFAVVLPATGKEEAVEMADKIRGTIERTAISLAGEETRVTISVGAAEWNRKWSEDHFIEMADQALYKSKEAGRNRVTAAC